jgi:hypothetical protein
MSSRSRKEVCLESAGEGLCLQDEIRMNSREIMEMIVFPGSCVEFLIIFVFRFIVLNYKYDAKIVKIS